MRTLQVTPQSIRANDDGTLTLEGLAVPYGQEIEFMGFRESFGPKAFDPDQVLNVPLLWSHDRAETIGHITAASNSDEGLTITAVVQPTSRGRDAQTLLRSKSLRGLSVGFEPIETKETKDAWTYVRAKLHELSVTPLPAYDKAQVTGTRAKETAMTGTPTIDETKTAEKTSPEEESTRDAPKIDLKPILDRIDQLEARSLEHKQPTRTISVREALALQLADAKTSGRIRALADVLSSGNSGVLPPAWSREVQNILDGMRYMFPHVGKVAFPSSGYTWTFPKVVNHTTVGPRGAEKTQIPSSALTTDEDTYTATWYAGGVDIPLELLLQSDPSIQAVVVDDMLRAYASVTDQALTSALEAAATAAGSTLDTTSYGAFVADIVTAGDQIRVATGQFGDQLSVTTASWKKIIGFVDTQGRRILSTGGATNSDGSAQLTASEVNIGGITVFHNPRAGEDMQFNTISARVSERPPLQVQSDNVALMGRDVGILGAMMDIPKIPTGIIVHSVTAAREGETRGRRK